MSKHPDQAPGDDSDEIKAQSENLGSSSDSEPSASEPSAAPKAEAQPGQEAPKAERDKAADLQAKIDLLETEKAELNDKYLRKAAEFENYRKRMIKEKEEARLYANTELLVELIGLLDDFDRAIQSAEATQDFKVLHEGVSMIQKAFLGKLEGRYGLKRFDSAGEAFDPVRHEALMAEQRADIDQATVIEDFMKGYVLHDRVIRPAKVKVAMPLKKDGAETPPAPPSA